MREPGLEDWADVSRETLDRLQHYETLLVKWNARINLVSKSTIPEIWTRHFLDSKQLFANNAKPATIWVDFGSGGGFPAMIIAILAVEKAPGLVIQLIESDGRKCAFLNTVKRETGAEATIHHARVADLPSLQADIVSARAFASLTDLLPLAKHHMKPDGEAIFPKGANWKKELDEARKSWNFSCVPTKSMTDPNAVVLNIRDIQHV